MIITLFCIYMGMSFLHLLIFALTLYIDTEEAELELEHVGMLLCTAFLHPLIWAIACYDYNISKTGKAETDDLMREFWRIWSGKKRREEREEDQQEEKRELKEDEDNYIERLGV